MKTVSKTFELQTLKLPQLPLGLPLQGFMLQGQIQGMLKGRPTLKTFLHMRWLPELRRNGCVKLIDQLST